MNPTVLIQRFLAYANTLRFRNLFIFVLVLFILDLLAPDFIPFIDEIILGLLAILLANLKKERKAKQEGQVIEGEIIEEIEHDKKD